MITCPKCGRAVERAHHVITHCFQVEAFLFDLDADGKHVRGYRIGGRTVVTIEHGKAGSPSYSWRAFVAVTEVTHPADVLDALQQQLARP